VSIANAKLRLGTMLPAIAVQACEVFAQGIDDCFDRVF